MPNGFSEKQRDIKLKFYEEHPEVRLRIGQSLAKLWENPKYRLNQQKLREGIDKRKRNSKIACSVSELWKDDEYRKTQTLSHQKSSKEMWESEEYRQNWYASRPKHIHTEKSRETLSAKAKLRWQDKAFCQEVMAKVLRRRPTKPELKLTKILNEEFLGEWMYSGDGQVWIVRMNPDFWNINGRKMVIELYGDYWHRNDDPKIRVRNYKRHGVSCLIIWEHEIKDKASLIRKIGDFMACHQRRSQ